MSLGALVLYMLVWGCSARYRSTVTGIPHKGTSSAVGEEREVKKDGLRHLARARRAGTLVRSAVVAHVAGTGPEVAHTALAAHAVHAYAPPCFEMSTWEALSIQSVAKLSAVLLSGVILSYLSVVPRTGLDVDAYNAIFKVNLLRLGGSVIWPMTMVRLCVCLCVYMPM